MSWKNIGLVEGVKYRVTEDLESPMDGLSKDEIVESISSSYSRYDSATILLFRCDDGEPKQLFVHDEIDLKPAFFEKA